MSNSKNDRKDLLAWWAYFLAGKNQAVVIESNNAGTSGVPLSQALRNDTAFAIAIRDDFLAIDIDDPSGVCNALEFASEWSQYKSLICESGGEAGRAHLFLNIPDPEKLQIVAAAARERGFDCRSVIRPPYSRHRCGHSFSEPIGQARSQQPFQVFDHQAHLEREISHRLRVGWHLGRRSEGLFWLAHAFQSIGKGVDEYVSEVLSHPQGAGVKPFERAPARAEKYLLMTWKKAKTLDSRRNKRERILSWVLNLAREDPEFFLKRADLIFAIAEITIKSQKITFDLSVRNLADYAGCGKSTAQTGLSQLVCKGFLKVVHRGTRRVRTATVYQIITKPGQTNINTPPYQLVSMSENLELVSDCFFARSAQRSMFLILAVCGSNFLFELCSNSPSLMSRSMRLIKLLRDQGLAVCIDGEWVVSICSASLGAVADKRGTTGTYRRRFEKHLHDRDNFSKLIVNQAKNEGLDT